ncbi:MAG: hypothetical protein ABFD96_12090 [Armatimonadia bacterium]
MRRLLVIISIALALPAVGEQLVIDSFDGGKLEKWSTSMSPDYYKGNTGQKGLQIVNDPERGQVLAADVRFVDPTKSEPCFISKDLTTPLPIPRLRTVSFWYKLGGDACLDPNGGFRLRLRNSPTDFTDYDIAAAPPVGKWVHCTIDTKPSSSVRNIWGRIFGDVTQLTFRLDDVDSRNAQFTLLVDDIVAEVDQAAQATYTPTEYKLQRDGKLDVLMIRHAAAGHYQIERVLCASDPKAVVEAYPFKGLHFGLDLYGFPKTIQPLLKTDLIVLVDVDPFIFTPEQAKWLADLVNSGAGMLFCGGVETLAKSKEFKRPIADILPVTFSTGYPQFQVRKTTLPGDATVAASYVQKLEVKPGATVALQAEDRPLLITSQFGKGRVAVLNAMPGLDRTDDLFLNAAYPQWLQDTLAWVTQTKPAGPVSPLPPLSPPRPVSTFEPLNREDFFPIITMAGSGSGGHYLDEEGIRADIERMKDYGFNTIAVGGLNNLARATDPPSASVRNSLGIERIAHELDLATIYEYSGFNAINSQGATTPCVFSPEYAKALADKLTPQLEVARRVPRLLSVKILDEPTVNPKMLDYCEYCQKVFQARYNIPLRKLEDIPATDTYARWAMADFMGYYVAEGYRQSYEFKQKSGAEFDLLLTYMSTGLGYDRPLSNHQDALDWSRWADRIDFDVYPYFYPVSQKIRMLQAAWCMAYIRQISQHLGKPWGFYVELDDRNWPFQQNPKQASAECAYEAVLQGADYLNSFIHTTFGTGTDSRPERWAWTGQELPKISKLGPVLARTARAQAPVAFLYPNAQNCVTNEPVTRPYTYACVSQGFGNVDILPEEVALEKKAIPYKVLVMLGTDLVHGDLVKPLEEWVRAGGLLILDKVPTRNHRGEEVKLPFDFPAPNEGGEPERLPYYQCTLGKGRVVKLGYDPEALYKDAVEGDRLAEAAALRRKMAEALGLTGIRPTAVVVDKPAQMEVGVRQSKGEALVIVLNHDAAGNEGAVTERGLGFKPSWAYDAGNRRSFNVQATPDGCSFRVKLPARQGAMIYLSPTRPKVLPGG